MQKTPNPIKLIISVGVPLLGGLISGYFVTQNVETWYMTLNKPIFTPPPWLFAPTWTILYIAMGLAAYLVWIKGFEVPGVKTALVVFIFQLILNFAWTPVFFGLKNPLGGLIIIAVLWLAITTTIILFIRISLPAGLLLVPYLLWVSYATALNNAIWTLNR